MKWLKSLFQKFFGKRDIVRELSDDEEIRLYLDNRIDQIEDVDERIHAVTVMSYLFNYDPRNDEGEAVFSSLGLKNESEEQKKARKTRAYDAYLQRKAERIQK